MGLKSKCNNCGHSASVPSEVKNWTCSSCYSKNRNINYSGHPIMLGIESGDLKDSFKMIKWIVLIIVVFTVIFGSIYTISAGERGVLLTFGKPNMESVGEGLHFKWPLAQSIKVMEVRTQKIETGADSVTRDLQSVATIVALNYHVSTEEAPKLYQEVGMNYRERIINPSIQESVKAVMAKYKIEELTDKRPEVSRGIKEFLTERLKKYNIIVDDFNVINFEWSEEFKKSIEDKLTAEQKKLKAEMDLERIKVEKEQKITQAEAEAESIRIQSIALNQNKDILELRAIEKWDGVMPKVTGGATPFIDISTIV